MTNIENSRLHLNGFQNTIQTAWKELQFLDDFSDVTIACDDKQIKTHKVVIASKSPVIRNILKQIDIKNPFIFIPGVKVADLENVINFMYQGELKCDDKDLAGCLKLAEDLRIEEFYNENKTNFKSKTESLPKRQRVDEKYLDNNEYYGMIYGHFSNMLDKNILDPELKLASKKICKTILDNHSKKRNSKSKISNVDYSKSKENFNIMIKSKSKDDKNEAKGIKQEDYKRNVLKQGLVPITSSFKSPPPSNLPSSPSVYPGELKKNSEGRENEKKDDLENSIMEIDFVVPTHEKSANDLETSIYEVECLTNTKTIPASIPTFASEEDRINNQTLMEQLESSISEVINNKVINNKTLMDQLESSISEEIKNHSLMNQLESSISEVFISPSKHLNIPPKNDKSASNYNAFEGEANIVEEIAEISISEVEDVTPSWLHKQKSRPGSTRIQTDILKHDDTETDLESNLDFLNTSSYEADSTCNYEADLSKVIKCDKCPKTFPSEKILSKHKKEHVNRKIGKNNPEQIPFYRCSLCTEGRNFHNAASMLVHIEGKHINPSVTTVKCCFSKCPYKVHKSKFKVDLLRHLRSKHTVEKLFQCNHCTKDFSSYLTMINHEKKHSNGNQCNKCLRFYTLEKCHFCSKNKK